MTICRDRRSLSRRTNNGSRPATRHVAAVNPPAGYEVDGFSLLDAVTAS